MLPIPSDKYIPKIFNRDSKMTAFTGKIDSILTETKNLILGLNDIYDPVACPAYLLDYIGNFLQAGILSGDSTDSKRKKIASAIQGHKRRGSFNLDAKPKIDAICGGDSEILKAVGGDDWILVGYGDTPISYYWSALGADGIDDDLGISLIGEGIEIEVAGNIYINVDNNSLSSDDQNLLRETLEDIVPAYFYTHIGYLNLSSQFIEYFVMGV